MPRRRRSFFFDNIHKKLKINTLETTKTSRATTSAGLKLEGYLDANGNKIDMGTNDITDAKVGQWNTAYGWGDHASAGYTTYSNSDVDAHLNQSNPTSGYILSWNGSDYAWIAQAAGFSGNYNDLTNKPTIPTNNNQLSNGAGYQVASTWTSNATLSTRSTAAPDTAGDAQGISAHYMNQSATNSPTGTDHSLLTLAYSSAWQTQLAGDWRTNKWYVREQNNGTWGAWDQILTTADTTPTFTSVNLVDGNTLIGEGGGNSLRIETNSGYVDIGPMNSSWCHFSTDRGQFYFGQNVQVDGQIYKYSGTVYWGAHNDGSGSGLDADTLDGTQLSGIKTSSTTDTNNVWIRNASPTVYFRDTNHRGCMLHNNSNLFYVLRGSQATDSTSWATVNGRWPLTINLGNNDATFGGNVTAYSDARLKENVEPIGITIEQFKSLEAKRFDWKADGKHDVGFIAQDVEAAGLVEVVKEHEDRDPGTGELLDTYKTLDYARMVPFLWDIVQKQQKQIEELQAKIS